MLFPGIFNWRAVRMVTLYWDGRRWVLRAGRTVFMLAGVVCAAGGGLAVALRIEISALLPGGLDLFDRDAVLLGIGIVADARHHPGHLDVGLIGLDGKLVALDFAGHNGLGELADGGELVA